ncbi:uncharacterized protein DFL_002554 [Arthrobotrys flagrans]|uniref:F5/8 type C domain-containing protein n=1 Tax=Arthrobotrys flagrans TaxID=97331 RepID=A0A437ABZ1_ARTFL|nr:hypothetical protein DFL_002554 [Arthrobotrys flagrans]
MFSPSTSAHGEPITRVALSEAMAYPGALAYSTLEHKLYSIEPSSSSMLRIAGDGSVKKVTSSMTFVDAQFGDIDSSGQYWISTGFYGDNTSTWIQMDLNLCSPKYGQVVSVDVVKRWEGGPAKTADRAYVPSSGRFLWSLGANSLDNDQLTLFGYSSWAHVHNPRSHQFSYLDIVDF